MIVLAKSSCELLNYLIQLKEPKTIMAISKELGQSRRKIYYHIEKINEALPKVIEPLVSYPRLGIFLSDSQRQACQLLFDDLNDYTYVMSAQERMQLMIIYIAISDKRVTIEQLMQLVDVSRNTILNDLTIIRRDLSLEQYNIKLHVTKVDGYYIDCHPLTKIQYLYKIVYRIFAAANENFIAIVRKKMLIFTGHSPLFSNEFFIFLTNQLFKAQANKNLGKKLSRKDREYMIHILPYLLLGYRNMHMTAEIKKDVRKDFSLAQKRLEYGLAISIANKLQQGLSIQLDENEIGIIAMLLLSYRKDSDAHLQSHDYDEMRKTLDRFILELENMYSLNFTNRETLLNQLLTHCKSLVFRKTYGIISNNPLKNHVIDKYTSLFAMTKSSCWILEEDWLIHLTDDDIAYLTIHIGGELRASDYKQSKMKRVLLVCDDGVAIQKLFLKQCEEYIKHIHVEAVFTSEQFQSVKDLLQNVYIITTIADLKSPLPILVVNPIMTDKDIVRLMIYIRTGEHERSIDLKERLDNYIKQYVKDDKDVHMLSNKVEKLLLQELRIELIWNHMK